MCLSRGTVEIFVEPVKADRRLVVLGASPVAQAIVGLAQTLGYRVIVAAAAADHAKIPGAATYIDGFALDDLKSGADDSVIVATQGKGDRDALRVALRLAPAMPAWCAAERARALRTRLLEEATDLARPSRPARTGRARHRRRGRRGDRSVLLRGDRRASPFL
jgi:xanthine dehydrogenase accessory factor